MKPTQKEIEDFSNEILKISVKNKTDYLDAIVSYCDINNIEIELAAKLLTSSIKQSIESEARENNLIRKYPVLPI